MTFCVSLKWLFCYCWAVLTLFCSSPTPQWEGWGCTWGAGSLGAGGVPAPVASCPVLRAGEGGEGGISSGVFVSPSHRGAALWGQAQATIVFLSVFYFSEFCCCLGRLMHIDNDFIRKRPSHFYPVIGGNCEDAQGKGGSPGDGQGAEWGLGFTFTITMEGAAGDDLGSLCQYFL